MKRVVFLICLFAFSVSFAAEKGLVENVCSWYQKRKFMMLAARERVLFELSQSNATYPDCFYRAVGTLEYLKGDYTRALKAYLRVKHADCGDSVNISALYLRLGKVDEADSLLSLARAQCTSEPGVFYNSALVMIKKGKMAKARDFLVRVLNVASHDSEVRKKALKLLNFVGY